MLQFRLFFLAEDSRYYLQIMKNGLQINFTPIPKFWIIDFMKNLKSIKFHKFSSFSVDDKNRDSYYKIEF